MPLVHFTIIIRIYCLYTTKIPVSYGLIRSLFLHKKGRPKPSFSQLLYFAISSSITGEKAFFSSSQSLLC